MRGLLTVTIFCQHLKAAKSGISYFQARTVCSGELPVDRKHNAQRKVSNMRIYHWLLSMMLFLNTNLSAYPVSHVVNCGIELYHYQKQIKCPKNSFITFDSRGSQHILQVPVLGMYRSFLIRKHQNGRFTLRVDEFGAFLLPEEMQELSYAQGFPESREVARQNIPDYRHSHESGNPTRTVDPRLRGDDEGMNLSAASLTPVGAYNSGMFLQTQYPWPFPLLFYSTGSLNVSGYPTMQTVQQGQGPQNYYNYGVPLPPQNGLTTNGFQEEEKGSLKDAETQTPTAPDTSDKEIQTPTATDTSDQETQTPTAPDTSDQETQTPTATDTSDKEIQTPTATDTSDQEIQTPTAKDTSDQETQTPTAPDTSDQEIQTSIVTDISDQETQTSIVTDISNRNPLEETTSVVSNRDEQHRQTVENDGRTNKKKKKKKNKKGGETSGLADHDPKHPISQPQAKAGSSQTGSTPPKMTLTSFTQSLNKKKMNYAKQRRNQPPDSKEEWWLEELISQRKILLERPEIYANPDEIAKHLKDELEKHIKNLAREGITSIKTKVKARLKESHNWVDNKEKFLQSPEKTENMRQSTVAKNDISSNYEKMAMAVMMSEPVSVAKKFNSYLEQWLRLVLIEHPTLMESGSPAFLFPDPEIITPEFTAVESMLENTLNNTDDESNFIFLVDLFKIFEKMNSVAWKKALLDQKFDFVGSPQSIFRFVWAYLLVLMSNDDELNKHFIKLMPGNYNELINSYIEHPETSNEQRQWLTFNLCSILNIWYIRLTSVAGLFEIRPFDGEEKVINLHEQLPFCRTIVQPVLKDEPSDDEEPSDQNPTDVLKPVSVLGRFIAQWKFSDYLVEELIKYWQVEQESLNLVFRYSLLPTLLQDLGNIAHPPVVDSNTIPREKVEGYLKRNKFHYIAFSNLFELLKSVQWNALSSREEPSQMAGAGAGNVTRTYDADSFLQKLLREENDNGIQFLKGIINGIGQDPDTITVDSLVKEIDKIRDFFYTQTFIFSDSMLVYLNQLSIFVNQKILFIHTKFTLHTLTSVATLISPSPNESDSGFSSFDELESYIDSNSSVIIIMNERLLGNNFRWLLLYRQGTPPPVLRLYRREEDRANSDGNDPDSDSADAGQSPSAGGNNSTTEPYDDNNDRQPHPIGQNGAAFIPTVSK
ncbi:hypothetical protein EZMO1_3731 [Endozoicomonas montiporae CL-33]|nr:hypothetical protein EZMO1_3731 [Endozoicomonas montiporae CL-33]